MGRAAVVEIVGAQEVERRRSAAQAYHGVLHAMRGRVGIRSEKDRLAVHGRAVGEVDRRHAARREVVLRVERDDVARRVDPDLDVRSRAVAAPDRVVRPHDRHVGPVEVREGQRVVGLVDVPDEDVAVALAVKVELGARIRVDRLVAADRVGREIHDAVSNGRVGAETGRGRDPGRQSRKDRRAIREGDDREGVVAVIVPGDGLAGGGRRDECRGVTGVAGQGDVGGLQVLEGERDLAAARIVDDEVAVGPLVDDPGGAGVGEDRPVTGIGGHGGMRRPASTEPR